MKLCTPSDVEETSYTFGLDETRYALGFCRCFVHSSNFTLCIFVFLCNKGFENGLRCANAMSRSMCEQVILAALQWTSSPATRLQCWRQ